MTVTKKNEQKAVRLYFQEGQVKLAMRTPQARLSPLSTALPGR